MVPVRRTAQEKQSAVAVEEPGFEVSPAETRPRVRRPRVKKLDGHKEPGKRQPSRFDEFDDFSREIELEMPYDPKAIASRASAPRRVRRGLRLPEATWARWTLGAGAAVLLGGAVAGGVVVRNFFRQDPRFRIASSDAVVVTGNHQVSADEIRALFAEDIGRNIFYVPLEARREQLKSMPWVHLATVERLLPDHIGVQIEERVPTAFVQNNGTIDLVDADGVVMDMPSVNGGKYSFPVLTGLDESVPQADRAARMVVYEQFVREINGGSAHVSDRVSELDLTDPEDVVATLPSGDTQYTVHFGDEHFLDRWKMYESHLADWKQQYPNLASMDLRNAPQVTLGMSKGTPISDADALAEAAAADAAANKAAAKPSGPKLVSATAVVRPALAVRSAEPALVKLASPNALATVPNKAAATKAPSSAVAKAPSSPKALASSPKPSVAAKPVLLKAAAPKPATPGAARPRPPAVTALAPAVQKSAPAKKPAVVTGVTKITPATTRRSDQLATFNTQKPTPAPPAKMALHAHPEQAQ